MLDKLKKSLEAKTRELQAKLEDAAAVAAKGERKAQAALQLRLREVESECDSEKRHHFETQKGYRKLERRLNEMNFQFEDDQKVNSRLQESVNKLQVKLKITKKALEDAEHQANQNLIKYRKSAQELEKAEERAEISETALNRFRSKSRLMTTLISKSAMQHNSVIRVPNEDFYSSLLSQSVHSSSKTSIQDEKSSTCERTPHVTTKQTASQLTSLPTIHITEEI